MATVKGLEERTDQMADDVSSVVAALDRLGVKVDALTVAAAATQTQLAVLGSRVDNLVAVIAATQSQLNAVLATVQATQTQLAVVAQRVDASAARLDQVEKKVETLSLSYTAFEAKGEVTNKLLRWVGGLAALAIISFIGFGYGLARHAGSLDEKVQHHQDTLNEIKAKLK